MTSDEAYRDTQYSRMLLALGGFIVFGIGVAVGAVFGSESRFVLWILGIVGLLGLLARTRLQVCVDVSGVRVGRASVSWAFVDRIEVLEGDAMRAAISTGAHPSDYIRLRGTTAGMRVWLKDETDPCRAWVVSVREPRQLTRVLRVLEPMRGAHG